MTWELLGYYNEHGGVVSPLEGTGITATFLFVKENEAALSGFAGCNHYVGYYRFEGNTVASSTIRGGNRVCTQPEGVMEQEAALLQVLRGIVHYEIEGNLLTLKSASGSTVARFGAGAVLEEP